MGLCERKDEFGSMKVLLPGACSESIIVLYTQSLEKHKDLQQNPKCDILIHSGKVQLCTNVMTKERIMSNTKKTPIIMPCELVFDDSKKRDATAKLAKEAGCEVEVIDMEPVGPCLSVTLGCDISDDDASGIFSEFFHFVVSQSAAARSAAWYFSPEEKFAGIARLTYYDPMDPEGEYAYTMEMTEADERHIAKYDIIMDGAKKATFEFVDTDFLPEEVGDLLYKMIANPEDGLTDEEIGTFEEVMPDEFEDLYFAI